MIEGTRQLFHPNHANTVGEGKTDDLTADFMVYILHPAGLFTADCANHMELLRFTQRSPQSRISSANESALAVLEKQRFRSNAGNGDITKSQINAHCLGVFSLLDFNCDRDSQIDASSVRSVRRRHARGHERQAGRTPFL